MHETEMFDRSGSLSLEGFRGSGADWMERYKPPIEDGETVMVTPPRPMDRRTITWSCGSANGTSARSSWQGCRPTSVSRPTYASLSGKDLRSPW
jgi:hypothetical protein